MITLSIACYNCDALTARCLGVGSLFTGLKKIMDIGSPVSVFIEFYKTICKILVRTCIYHGFPL